MINLRGIESYWFKLPDVIRALQEEDNSNKCGAQKE
jgi:hypothetical protein